MKILITGGNGFIARSIAAGLEDKHEIISLNSTELNLIDSDYVIRYIKNNKFDTIIHTATYDAAHPFTSKDRGKVLEYNLRMFFNLIRCKSYFGKMIYFGSGAEFGREYWEPKMTESYFDKFVPNDPYGLSKYIMTKSIHAEKDIFNLRLFGVYGKYDDWRYRFIPNTCIKALFDMPITINQNVFFDYLYIEDLVRIVEWFIEKRPQKNVYNVCTGNVSDLKTIACKILKVAGKELDIKVNSDKLGNEYSGDNSNLLKEMNKFVFTPLEKSINEIYEFYQRNEDGIKTSLFFQDMLKM